LIRAAVRAGLIRAAVRASLIHAAGPRGLDSREARGRRWAKMVRRGLAVSSLLAWVALAALSGCHTRTLAQDGGLDAGSGDASFADVPGALTLDFAATGCARADAGAAPTAPLDAGPDATAAGGGGATVCSGAAPLTLTFTPVSSSALTRFRWTFGDGSPPSSERAPTHTYVLPGAYDVAVVAAGPTGSLSRQRPGFVAVTANAAGAPCDVDAQCAPGLFCLCGQSAPCGDAFPRGICTSACPPAGCAGGTACARVDVPPPAAPDAGTGAADAGAAGPTGDAAGEAPTDTSASNDGAANDASAGDGGRPETAGAATVDAGAALSGDATVTGDASPPSGDAASGDASAPDGGPAAPGDAARAPPRPLCLAACAADADCALGLVCRALPGGTSGTFTNVCVPPFYRRVADSCRDAEGRLDDHVCSTGLCANLGAIGLCSASCAGGAACPTGAACATFGDGRSFCLVTCTADETCTRDPLLACETGAGGGALGFTTSPPAPTATFCAPRSCTSQADCAPSGTCKPLGVGAHCVAN
jgi:PKD repeat protein